MFTDRAARTARIYTRARASKASPSVDRVGSRGRIWNKTRESVDREQLSDLCPWLFQPLLPPLSRS